MKQKIEILSPAGSYECLIAAVKAGADAVYVGGSKFGARANAVNFSEDELKNAIDLMHLHGRQLYLTINTLIKEEELNKELYNYIYPLYMHGLDAVIIQDLGVLAFVKEYFPDLPIHASTQMTVTNLLSAKFLEAQGVERIVTSRELSIHEVREINANTNLEIESFVHGALCYSYSGQCLFSSMIGGRSGNRGQCAQPCRLPYHHNSQQDYILSLKDICTLHDIPDLIDAGVNSFKIEGRMKKPEYVASVTSMYRKYIDLYMMKGRAGYSVSEEDLNDLKDIFNRGDFHGGYWKQYNGANMITPQKPNHTGIPVLKVMEQKGRIVTARAMKSLHKGDILEISNDGDNYTLGNDFQIGDMVELSLRKGVTFLKNDILYRTRNQWLIHSIYNQLDSNKLQESIDGTLVLIKDSNASLHLNTRDIHVSVEGSIVEAAQNSPVQLDKIRNQMCKTGNTPFVFNDMNIIMDEHIFIPNQQLNQLRREGLALLESVIVQQYRRNTCKSFEPVNKASRNITKKTPKALYHVYVETLEQLNIVKRENIFTNIYIDANMIPKIWENSQLSALVESIKAHNKSVFLVMPHIFRTNTIEVYQQNFHHILKCNFDGIMIRNLESFQFLRNQSYSGEIYLDHHVYVFNSWSNIFWDNMGVTHKTNSLELTYKELQYLNQEDMDLVIYGRAPNMLSAQCIKKTSGKCNHTQEVIKIKDRFNKEFPVKSCCDYCYNIIYHYCPTNLLEEIQEIRRLGVTSLRIDFTTENEQEVKAVVQDLYSIDNKELESQLISLEQETTKGHFRRGVR